MRAPTATVLRSTFGDDGTMSLGHKYFRSNLIKLMILSAAFPFILWDFFSGKDTKSEPGAIYLLIFIWIGGTAFLVWKMVRTKRRERESDRMLPAEPDGPAHGSQPFRSGANRRSSSAGSRR